MRCLQKSKLFSSQVKTIKEQGRKENRVKKILQVVQKAHTSQRVKKVGVRREPKGGLSSMARIVVSKTIDGGSTPSVPAKSKKQRDSIKLLFVVYKYQRNYTIMNVAVIY